MADERFLGILADQNAAATAAVRQKVLTAVQALWQASPAFRDADVERLINRIVPLVQAGQVQVAQLTSVYLAHEAALLRDVGFAPAAVDKSALQDVRGVAMAEVYARPAVSLYTALSDGKSFLEAKQAGLLRLMSLATTDMQLAKTTQANVSLKKSGAKYFQRSLSGSENCAICVVAAHQRYRTGELMPIHPGCDCGVRELPGSKDPGQTIDQDSLDLMHAQIESQFGISDRGGRAIDYSQIMVVQQHGELGPVLTWRGQNFTGPDDLPQ